MGAWFPEDVFRVRFFAFQGICVNIHVFEFMVVALSSRASLYLDIHFHYKKEVFEAVALPSDVVKNFIYYCRIERQSNFITFLTCKT